MVHFRDLAMKADPRPGDPSYEVYFGTDEQIAWDKKYHVSPM
jgi:hypothetical protein